MKYTSFLFFIFTTIGAQFSFAQDDVIAPKYSNEFLAIGIGADALGLANSVVAQTGNVNSGYWNPAGLVKCDKWLEVGLMHSEYFAGIAKYDYLGLSHSLDDKSTVGFSAIRFAVDDIPNTTQLIDNNGNIDYDRITTFTAADYAFLFSYARQIEKIPGLKPAFTKDGTITAANASTMNDGAAALVLMSQEKAEALGIKPIAILKSYADAEQAPEWFTTAPSKAVPVALAKAGLSVDVIDYWELNEAFSVVGIVNTQKLGLDPSKVDVNGGAVALGHPLGSSGSRIIVTLVNVLKQNGGKYGAARICNGGGGASAMVIENVQ